MTRKAEKEGVLSHDDAHFNWNWYQRGDLLQSPDNCLFPAWLLFALDSIAVYGIRGIRGIRVVVVILVEFGKSETSRLV